MLTSYFAITRQVAIGQFVTLKQLFKSDQILTGEVLKFHPILYSSQLLLDSQPKEHDFQILYPPGAGEYDFTNLFSENYKATLKVVDGSNFEISYSFFVTKPFATHSNAFVNTANYEGNVAFYVKIDNDSTIANVPLSVKGFCQDTFEIFESGFVPGDDLPITFKTSGTASNNFYIGLVKNDAISNTDIITPGLIINYGKVSLGADQVSDLPFEAFLEGYGFQESGGESIGSVTIDGSYLKANSTYRVYIVYYKNGNWHSCISGVIEQTASNSPIIPDATYVTTDEFGNEGLNCISGLSEFLPIDLSFTVDVADYNSQLTEKGITGTFDDYFVSARAFESNNAASVTGKFLSMNDSNPTFSVTGYKPNSAGQKFVIFQLRFDYPTHTDFINYPFSLNYNAIELPIGITVNGGVGQLCEGEEYSIDQTLDPNCFLYQSVNGSAWVENTIITGQSIDVESIPEFGTACFKLVCSNGQSGPTEEDCECPECATTLTARLFASTGPNPAIREIICQLTGAGTLIVTETVSNTSDSATGVSTCETYMTVPYPQSFYNFKIEFTCENGCIYIGYASTSLLSDSYDVQINLLATTLNEDCDCPEPPAPCKNYASIVYNCDNETGEITVATNNSFESAIESEELLMSTDGGLTFIPCPESILGFESVFLTYEVSFSDGCLPIHLEQVVECIKIPYVINGRTIVLSVSGNLLYVAITDNFESDVLSDKLYVSLDNGETYTKFDLLDEGYTPMEVVGDEKIIAYTETIFEDGHIDLIATGKLNLKLPTVDCAGYGAYTLTATFDEENNTFTVVKAGDESSLVVNQLLWTIGGGNPFDVNQTGVPYYGPVSGEGVFIARWKVRLPNCPEMILDAMAWGKACIKLCDDNELNVNITNLTEIGDININLDPIEITWPDTPIEVCIVECCEVTELTVECIDHILIVTGAAPGAVITWSGPNDYTAAGNNVPIGDDGLYQVTATEGSCISIATYEHTHVSAGTPIDDPIDLD